MAELATGIIGIIISIAQCDAAHIKRQFDYLRYFSSNIKDLEQEANCLNHRKAVLEDRVQAEKNNGCENIYEEVKIFFKESDDIMLRKAGILARVAATRSGCLSFRKRLSLSKEAKKTAEDIRKLKENSEFHVVAPPPSIAAHAQIRIGKKIHEFNSRKRFEEEIIKTLEVRSAYKVGIWGIGGVGKTTLAKKILKRAFDDKLFNEVVDVTVAQQGDEFRIQKQISKQLGVTFEVESSRCGIDQLQKRLRQEQRTLILLDDVWKDLNLEELGIPCDSEWCTIILTSRQKDVLKLMKVENICQLGVLDEHEAWDFFKEITGTFVDDPILKPTAYQVMKECKGLLLALEIVGKAHIDMKHPDNWKLSVIELRKHNPKNIEYVIEEVYRPLKRSYDCLESKDTKLTFLLCSLFPEDADIPLEQLTYFATGLRLFQDFSELEEVKCCIRKSIDTLRNRSLLLDGSDEDHVRMHDVVRDVSIFITSPDNDENDVGVSIFAASNWVERSDCTWISSHVGGGARRDPPLPESCFPKLKLLWMDNKVEQEMEINDNLIGRSTELNVLFIEWGLMKSLPMHTTQALKKSLTTLILLDCKSLESVAAVGELKSLEILICRRCYLIKELPEQVRGLKRLKLLEISYCLDLESVAVGVISSMVALEEMEIVRSFKNWKGGETEDEGKEAAGLRELESLKKLRCLDIHVSDIGLAAQPLRLLSPDLLVQFSVCYGNESLRYNLPEEGYQRRMSLDFGDKNYVINLGDLSKNIFLTRTECLFARGDNQDFDLNLASAQGIRWLTLSLFRNKKNIASAAAAFPLLEYLSLTELHELEEIWDDDAPIPSNSFTNLKHLELMSLRQLKRMGKCVLSIAKNFFLQLETIDIKKCGEMEHLLVLVPTEEERDKEDGITLSFPKLESVDLENVPKLSSMICSSRRIESIQFPVLAHFEIAHCEKLKCFVSGEDDEHCRDDDDSLHLFCHPKVSFGGLKELFLSAGKMEIKNVWCDQIPINLFTGLVYLHIKSYTKTRRLFSSSKIPQNLVNLKELIIVSCPEMVSVIEDEEVSSSCDHTTEHNALFPSLQYLSLLGLPKLESFCEGRCALNLSSLKILEIFDCHGMKSFVSAPALQTVTINWEKLKPVNDDLNAALHQHFEKAKSEQKKKGGEGTSKGHGEIEEEE